MPTSKTNSVKEVKAETNFDTKPEDSFRKTQSQIQEINVQKNNQNYKVKMKYIKMMLKQKSTEDEFDSSDLELDFEDYMFKKTKNQALRKRKKRRKKYQLDKNPEIPFLSTDAKIHVLSIIKKAKTKEMKLLNKKRLLKTVEQTKKTSDIFKILYDSKKNTKEGQKVIRNMEQTLQDIEQEALSWDNS